MKGYSTQEVSDLIELKASTIREFARTGILDPSRAHKNHYRFGFQDIVVLRTAKELMEAGISRARINKALFKLKTQLPSDRSLTSLRIGCDGGSVVIRSQDQLYDPDSGQIHMNFSVADLAGSVAPLAKKAAELNKPLHFKPAKFERYQASGLLRAQHLAEQDMKRRKKTNMIS